MFLFIKKTHDSGILEGLTTLNVFFAGRVLSKHILLNYPILPLSIDFSYRRKKRIFKNLISSLYKERNFCYNCHSCIDPCGKQEKKAEI